MKKILLLPGAVYFSLLFVGCAARTAVLMDDYRGEKITGTNLTIVKLFEKPFLANGDDVLDDLGKGVPEEVYTAFFNENFPKPFKNSSCFNNVEYLNKFPVANLEEKTLDINDEEKMKILLPKDSCPSFSSDYVLFIDNIQISRIPASGGTWTGGMYSGGSFGKLFNMVYFAIWDNAKKRIVSYGKVQDESTVVFAMTKLNWESSLKYLAKKILDFSPFRYQNSIFKSYED